ncbi:hypothetical protein SAMCCGM7_Ch3160 [Sinorhizobium americanum CCGM7]|nr:hypothetical protein SAMCCGM7_Ch3160 [Sinorhizobium americanum CCGM7]
MVPQSPIWRAATNVEAPNKKARDNSRGRFEENGGGLRTSP